MGPGADLDVGERTKLPASAWNRSTVVQLVAVLKVTAILVSTEPNKVCLSPGCGFSYNCLLLNSFNECSGSWPMFLSEISGIFSCFRKGFRYDCRSVRNVSPY